MQTLIQPGVTVDGATRTGSIVVATDGLPESRGALAMARALAGSLRGTINVVAVHQSIALTAPDGQLLVDPKLSASLRADLTRRVREQCTSAGGDGALTEAVEVLNGELAHVINEVATNRHAQLIIVGLGRHELVDRIFGDETALKVARSSHVPVLAVPAGDIMVPRHAVVAIDFGEGSVRAARAALRLLSGESVLELVHVVPRDRLFDAWVSPEEYMRFVQHSLTRFRARLAIPSNIRLEDVILSGDPARELLSYAGRVGADLIAAGSHGHGFVTRLVIGSVTTKLVRMAACSVLVIPPTDQHIEIMLGQLGVDEPHLSRSIGGVDSLDVLTNRDDQDIALRLRHGEGQTILTLIR